MNQELYQKLNSVACTEGMNEVCRTVEYYLSGCNYAGKRMLSNSCCEAVMEHERNRPEDVRAWKKAPEPSLTMQAFGATVSVPHLP